jgi:membrane-bound serine protease (ClpP class)
MVLIMLNNDFFNFEFVPMGDIVMATFATVGGISGGMLLLIFGGARLTDTKAFKRISLNDSQESSQGFSVNSNTQAMMGKQGLAHTILRPSGKVLIEDQVYDAFTRGEFVEKGETIQVIGTEGVTLRVKKVS